MVKVTPKWIGEGPSHLEFNLETANCDAPDIKEDFHPLAFLSKLSLVLPLKNILKNEEGMYFDWYSFDVLLAVLLNPIVGYFLAIQIHYYDEDHRETVKEAAGFLVSNMWFLFGQNTLLSLIAKIDQFDHSIAICPKACYYKKLNKYVWILVACVYPLLLISVVGQSKYRDEPCTQYKCAMMELIRGFFRYQHQLEMVIYMFFCYEIKMRFRTLNVVFYEFIKTSYLGKIVMTDNYTQFESHRLQYAHLTKCTKALEDLFSWRFAFSLAVTILQILWLLYHFYTHEGYIVTGFDVLVVVYNLSLLFFVTYNTDLLVIESKKIERFLEEIPTQDLSWATTFQLDHTLHQCEMFQVHITASGMVTVERSLLLSMAGSISMYFIAILQMTTTVGSFSW